MLDKHWNLEVEIILKPNFQKLYNENVALQNKVDIIIGAESGKYWRGKTGFNSPTLRVYWVGP